MAAPDLRSPHAFRHGSVVPITKPEMERVTPSIDPTFSHYTR